MKKINLISIIIPVRNESANLAHFISRLSQVLAKEQENHFEFDLIVNNNCSTDNSLEILEEWASEDKRVRVFNFAYNKGFQGSLISGFKEAKGEAAIVLQSDLQDPPEMISEFLQAWRSGSKTVGGVIVKRHENFVSRTLRNIFYWLLSTSSNESIVRNFQDFYLVDKDIYLDLAQLPIRHSFIRAKISADFGIDTIVEYERVDRVAGKSNFNFGSKYSLALDAMLLYGIRLNRILTGLSFLTVLIFAITGVALVISEILGVRYAQPGWVSLTTLLLFGFSFIILILTVIVEYLFRMYKILSQNR